MAFPIVTPGSWVEISNTRLDSLPGITVPSTRDTRRLMDAWNGGCWNSRDRKLALMCNGGHGDGAGNSLLTFSADNLTWAAEILWPGNLKFSPDWWDPAPTDGIDPYPDGTPSSRHTYGHTVWIGTKYFTLPGSLWSGSGGVGGLPWTADPAFFPNPFTSYVQRAAKTGKNLGMIAGYDPVTKRVYVNSIYQFQSFDDAANLWTPRNASGQSNGPEEDPASHGTIDPVGRKLWWLGPKAWTGHPSNGAGCAAVALDDTGSNPPIDINLVSVGGSGDVSIKNTQGPGFVYDLIRRVFVAWGSTTFPNRLYIIDPTTLRFNAGTGRYDVDCRVEDPLVGTGPGLSGSPYHGIYGRMGHDIEDDVLVLAEATNKNVFLYRMQYRTTRVFVIANQTWVAQQNPLGSFKLAGGNSKHIHSVCDEAQELIVLIGGDTQAVSTADPQMDSYNVKTQVWTATTPRCGTAANLYQPDRVDNIIFVHDTVTPQYIGFAGFYASTQGSTLDQICGAGNHGIAIGSTDAMLYSRSTGLWSIAPWVAPSWGYGNDNTSTGPGCYDPVDNRVYYLYGDGGWGMTIKYLNIAAQTWGGVNLGTVTTALRDNVSKRDYLAIDVTGRKLYFLDAVLGKLAYMSIAAATFGTNDYVPTPTVVGYVQPPTVFNRALAFDNLNRVLAIPLFQDFAGAIYKWLTYQVDTDTWENWPLTSSDFPGGEAQGNFVCGNELVYDSAHNVFVLYGGNGTGTFQGSGNPVPRPTGIALWRYAGGPPLTVAEIPSVIRFRHRKV